MLPNLHPKCANPSCAAAFEWMAGGKLFRFHRQSGNAEEGTASHASPSHRMEHFWLCERCSTMYTLNYQPGQGVKIVSLWPQLPAAKSSMHLPSS